MPREPLPVPIHPFPARMAPSIIASVVARLPAQSTVLDPMVGSGTSARIAADRGMLALGFDLDPLAVLIARVWTTRIDTSDLRAAARDVLREARRRQTPALPWIDQDTETSQFIKYWFALPQRYRLRRLAAAISAREGPIPDALRVALSRIIITKDRGASLARDTSHSRPHRVRLCNDYDAYAGFLRSVDSIASAMETVPPRINARILIGDARHLDSIRASSVDLVVTSPPYLNAIDYMRAHRMSLVWLGYRLAELRMIRAESIGSERAPVDPARFPMTAQVAHAIARFPAPYSRQRGVVWRYSQDLLAISHEFARVLRPGGIALIAVANARMRGIPVRISRGITLAARAQGLTLTSTTRRQIKASARYLPPPKRDSPSALGQRIRYEVVQIFRKL